MLVPSLLLTALLVGQKPPPAPPVPVPVAPLNIKVLNAAAQPALQPPPPPPVPAQALQRRAVQIAQPMPDPTAASPSSVGGPADEPVLTAALIGTADEQLLEFFRSRTPPAPPREQLTQLIKELSSKQTAQRDAAQAGLTAIGQPVVPLLRPLANSTEDPDAAARARACLQNIEGPTAANLVIQAARLLAIRKPAEAAEVLIGYLPYAEDETAFAEIEAALVAVALREGKPDPALLKALKDPVTIRRGTAANVLCQAAGTASHAAIRPLLKDSRASVRLRAALGLVGAYDADAIPVLIDLLAELPPTLQQQAETYLIQLAGEWAVSGPGGTDQLSRRLRRDVWAAWWKNTEGALLLDEFRSRTFSEEERLTVASLLGKLSGNADERETAITALTAQGKVAVAPLRRLVSEGDPKVTPYALRCLEAIEKEAPNLPSAAARLLALRRPEGTVEALVSYLPFCESATVAEQILDILTSVGFTAGKPHPALVKALEDPASERRLGAALVLIRGRASEQLPQIRNLLKDVDRTVALRVAQALVGIGEKPAVPILISLLRELPLERAWDVEEFLSRLAGEKAPGEVLTLEPASRARVVEAWNKWWNDNEKTLDLQRLDSQEREQGLYLVVENWNPMLGRGRVLEVDAAGKIRWEITGLQWPNSAQLVRGGNVLVIEQQNKITERDRTGKVVGLDRAVPNVFHVERLRDGSTFIATRNQLQIIDTAGKTTFNHFYNANPILAVRRFADGSIAYVTYSGQYHRIDNKGKVLRNLNLNWVNRSPSGAEILPGDRVVLSDQNSNRVLEFSPDGRIAWETTVLMPLTPSVVAGGHLLVASNNQQSIVEIDRKGKIIKEWKDLSYKPFRVQRR